MSKTLICDCNQTIPLDPPALSQALGTELGRASQLCRREAGAFEQALQQAAHDGQPVVVACTQEQRLFSVLADQLGASEQPIRFVNLRESAGWGREGARSTPKMAALLAMARLPDPEPVPTVTYRSAGRLLIIGPLDTAEALAEQLDDVLDVTVFALGPGAQGGAQQRRYPVLAGQLLELRGWLGAFELGWRANNPIALDLCTRCNACVTACPENAIGLDYQVDLARCGGHRACVKVCRVGAIDFSRAEQLVAAESESFDLVLDLRGDTSAADDPTRFTQHAPPQGYWRWNPQDALGLPRVLLGLRAQVGEFEKPKFFQYKQKLCAHSRNTTIACQACIEVCSAKAVSSGVGDKHTAQPSLIRVNPHLCVGCGACTTACPTGALSYAYPNAIDQGRRLRTLLATYARAGGQDAVLLLHSQQAGQDLIATLGRQAMLGQRHGLPAAVLPVPVWHSASVGLELWLSALAWGARQVVVLTTDEEAPAYRTLLADQMAVAQALMSGLGYTGPHVQLLQLQDPAQLDQALLEITKTLQGARRVHGPVPLAKFDAALEKRSTLELALDHLIRHAPQPLPQQITLPAGPAGQGALLGSLQLDTERCTLCLSCVSACPASALQDNPQQPELRFLEKNCVQCGLCVKTCPEQALQLVPRLLLTPERQQSRVLHQVPPYACVRCAKPFGTLKAIEAMLGRLSGHPMFQGAALERLKMCGDCRVIDLHSASDETRITD